MRLHRVDGLAMDRTSITGGRHESVAPFQIGDEVELDPKHNRVAALLRGEVPCPPGPLRGRVQSLVDESDEIVILLASGEKATVPVICLRRVVRADR